MMGLASTYLHLGRRDEALPLYRELLRAQLAVAEQSNATPGTLNDAAMTLLTHELEELRDPERALGYAERACAAQEEAGSAGSWRLLDTLALAQHRTGDTAAAVRTQRRALELMPEGEDPEAAVRLAEYEAALEATAGAQPGGDGGG
jgi:tetratricopeptide (TPR) repeat protein